MKKVVITYTGDWTTTIEVPDAWDLTEDTARQLIRENRHTFDFTDGDACWEASSACFDADTDDDDLQVSL